MIFFNQGMLLLGSNHFLKFNMPNKIFATCCLRADVSKYRPEAYKSEKLKNPKKIHRVALVELLSEIYFLFRFDDYY